MTKLTYGAPEESGLDADRLALLRSQAPKWIDGFRTRSFVGLVARKGKIVFHEAYGPLTYEADSRPLQKDSIFSIASITKSITATAAMILMEDGKLGLNRPIKEYLPEICGDGTDNVQVQHLLTHTSGFMDETWYDLFMENKSQHADLKGDPASNPHPFNKTLLDRLWSDNTHWAPGTRMEYSNTNYDLLGEIIRRVSGQSLTEFGNSRIFAPLNLTDTSYVCDPSKAERSVRRGEEGPAGLMPGDPMSGFEGVWSQEAPWGSIGINSTALDLAQFGQLFLDSGQYESTQVLSPASAREMTLNQISGIGAEAFGRWHPEASWSLGWAVQDDERWPWVGSSLVSRGTIYHIGLGGHLLWIDPVHQIVGVYLSVSLDQDWEGQMLRGDADLFQNMVTAAVVD
jgi:CubicO group peptidase (beta-lactamase class C family)